MSFVSRPDGAEIFYKDWGDGPPPVTPLSRSPA